MKKLSQNELVTSDSLLATRKQTKLAFTMAEILLSLTIIGVVAAITLPSLTGNINERTWNTQRKALYSRMSQAISLMPALNGYGIGTNDTDTTNNAAETFITAGLSKVLKINNICNSNNLNDCGLSKQFGRLKDGQKIDLPTDLSSLNEYFVNISKSWFPSYSNLNTNAAAFETANGESIALYYIPNCQNNMEDILDKKAHYSKVCLNLIYDLNGKKGPNTIGKDMGFMTVFYPTDSILAAPNASFHIKKLESGEHTVADASSFCKLDGDEYRLPNVYEALAIQMNRNLTGYEGHNVVTGTRTTVGNKNGVIVVGWLTDTLFYTPNQSSNDSTFVHAYCITRY